jgi:diacylglycerol kinase (ATP)
MSDDAVHLFLNPAAGRGRAGRREPRIRRLLERCDQPVEMHLSRDVGDLEDQVHRAVIAGARRIVVAGGDGSVHEASNGIMSAGGGASVGVIPSGTGNDFAKACGVPLNWELATSLLAKRISEGTGERAIDIGRMNGRYFANGAGIGFDAKVTQIARSYRLPIGDLVYLLAIFRGMAQGIASPRLRITAGETIWDGPLTLANVANGPWVGGMFHIAPMADNGDGRFDLIIAAPVSRLRILSLLPKLMSARHVREKEISHEHVTDLLVEADDPVLSHLDGEMQRPLQRFEISILPGALHLL